MPKVPKLREVQVAPISTPYQQASGATSAAFGALEGQALSGVGQALQQTGEVVNQIAVKNAIEESERIAKELDVAFTRRKRELLYSKDGLYNKQGADAVGQSPAFKQRIHDLRDELTREVENERAKRLFNQTAAVRTEQEFLTIDGFVSKERKVAFQVASEARVKEAIDDAVTSGGDPTQLARSSAIINTEVHEQAEAQGWAPEVTVSKLEEARTALLKNVIVGHVKNGQTAQARAFLKEHKSEMDGPVAAQMEELVREADNIAEAQTAVDVIFSDPNLDTEAKRLAAARELPAGNLRLRAVQLTKVRNTEASEALAAKLDGIEGDAAQAVASGIPLDSWALENPIHFMALTRDTKRMKRLRDAEVAAVENRDYAITTDPEVFAAIAGLPAEQLAKLSDEELQRARLSLTPEDWEQVVLMRKSARNSLDEDADSFATLNDINGMMKRWAHPDLRWNDPKASHKLQLQRREMQTQMMMWAQRKLDRGEKVEAQDAVQEFLRLQQEAVNSGAYFGIFDSEALGVEIAAMPPEERKDYTVEIDDVSASYRAVVAGVMARYGVHDATDQEIAAMITGEVRQDATMQVNTIRAAQAARKDTQLPTRSPHPQRVLRNEARNQAAPTDVGSLESAIIPPVIPSEAKEEAATEPLPQNYEGARYDFLSESEGIRAKAYEDVKGITTVGIGFNMERKDAREVFARGTGNDDPTFFQRVRNGEEELSEGQIQQLFDETIAEAENVVQTTFPDTEMSNNEQLALVSLAFNNPSLIGPKLTAAMKAGEKDKVIKEILYNSNRSKNKGLAARRYREAAMFATGAGLTGMLPDEKEYMKPFN